MIFVTLFTDSDNNVFDNENIYFPFPFYKRKFVITKQYLLYYFQFIKTEMKLTHFRDN